MSITRMRKSFAHILKPVLIGIALIFFVTIFFGYSSYITQGSEDRRTAGQAIASIGGLKITAKEFYERVQFQDKMMKKVGGLSALDAARLKSSILESMIQERIRVLAAQEKKIEVGRREINRERKKLINEQLKQYRELYSGKNKKKLTDKQFDKLLRDTEGKTLKSLRKEIEEGLTTESIRQMLMIKKLEAQLKTSVGKIDDNRLKEDYKQAKVRQIFIKIDPTPQAQAKRKAEEVLKKARGSEDFAKLAREFSDDKLTKDIGGEVEEFIPVSSIKELRDLKAGQVGGLIETPSGYYIVKVEETKIELPKDFEKNKKELLKSLRSKLEDQVIAEYYDKVKESAKVEIYEPELKGYWLADQVQQMNLSPAERDKNYQQAINALDTAIKRNSDNAEPYAKKAEIYYYQGKLDKAATILSDILDKRGITEHVDLRKMLAQIYMQSNKKNEAVAQLKDVSEMSYDAQTHLQLQSWYTQLGREDLAAEETKWIEEHPAAMAVLQQQMAPQNMPDGGPQGKEAE